VFPARRLCVGTVCAVSSTSSTPDFYEVLGVARTASSEEIRLAFKLVSKRTHPDAGGNSGLFRLVAEANSVLSDPVRRAEYDRSLSASEKVVDDLARREAEVAMREAAVRLAQSAFVKPGAPSDDAGAGSGVSPGVSVAAPVLPVVRRFSWEWFLLYWRGWIASTLVLSLGPVVWVLFRALDVWGVLAVAAGFVAFRFRVYLLVRGWSQPLRRSVGSAWLFAGAALPVLPSVWGFALLVVAAVLPFGVGGLWGRLRSSGGR
jgi:hypothetical protein